MDYRSQLKRDLDNEEEQKKIAYLQNCDENERKMLERQETYKNKFVNFDNALQNRQKLFERQVVSPQQQKMKQRVDWEVNGGH